MVNTSTRRKTTETVLMAVGGWRLLHPVGLLLPVTCVPSGAGPVGGQHQVRLPLRSEGATPRNKPQVHDIRPICRTRLALLPVTSPTRVLQDTGAVGGWRLLAVGGGWRLAVGRWWRWAVGGWRLAVGGPWGLSLGALLNENKNIGLYKDTAVGHMWGWIWWDCAPRRCRWLMQRCPPDLVCVQGCRAGGQWARG